MSESARRFAEHCATFWVKTDADLQALRERAERAEERAAAAENELRRCTEENKRLSERLVTQHLQRLDDECRRAPPPSKPKRRYCRCLSPDFRHADSVCFRCGGSSI